MRSSRSPVAEEDQEDEEEADEPQAQNRAAIERPAVPVQAGAESCSWYDFVPTIAAPQATQVNCVVTSRGLRWFFTGGQDGYIRKYDFHQTLTGKLPLTVAQRHPFVDSVQKAGVLLSYWKNEELPESADALLLSKPSSQLTNKQISPIHCLAVHSEALWILSGLQSGAINLQAVRVEEGRVLHVMRGHTGPVSVLQLSGDDRSLLSGSWDKRVHDWDMETGQIRRTFAAGNDVTGQVSAIAVRNPDAAALDESVFVDEADRAPLVADQGQEEEMEDVEKDLPSRQARHSPASTNSFDPLFDEDDDAEPVLPTTEPPKIVDGTVEPASTIKVEGDEFTSTASNVVVDNGLDQIFLTACVDGTLSLWDRRRQDPIVRIPVPRGTPPWCLSACFSHDGEFFYCGRRNGTVEEFSMRKGNFGAELGSARCGRRVIKMPNNSGPVSSVRSMPNGRSLLCASYDNVRLYDLQSSPTTKGMPFLIVPGHHGGIISQLYVDDSCRYAFSTSGNRGWDGSSTEVILGYEIGIPQS
ncbi:WD40-repeat-containing domain protein [Protomyces lactucae-debilis]|uniref:WD40-repeat-containing domain protein n=1 Tax=Protomyces lactucae-debilis TaxID=2754530 RepID=A0A1Y2FH58_PROLT|nr:WD40-repeat-containing domain protein [Protomyces lactucae-debilis]ORY83272.1 WD40-repeat-containing domain protein [Protomyces lactucae-debilis]